MGYQTEPPLRCKECTDLVKFIVELIPDEPYTENDAWRGNCYDG